MLIDIPELSDKKLNKIISKINKESEKGNWNKMESNIEELLNWMNSNKEQSNIILYILSILGEEKPELISYKILKQIKHFLQSDVKKEKANAIIILGTHLIHQLSQENTENMENLETFLTFLTDPEESIRQNVIYLLEQIPTTIDNQLLLYMKNFTDLLQVEKNPEILESLGKIMIRLQPFMSLLILKEYIEKLSKIYSESSIPARSDLILDLLELEIPKLKNREKAKLSKKQIQNLIQDRPPIARLTDIQQLARKEEMSEEDVENYLRSNTDEEKIYYFIYSERTQKKMLEFIKSEIKSFLSHEYIKISDLTNHFEYLGISKDSIIAVLLKDLISREIIRGYLTKTHYYSWNYLKKDMIQRLQRDGEIVVSYYSTYLDSSTVQSLIEEISHQSSLDGVYNMDKSKFQSYSAITKQIESEIAKNNIVDMKKYRDLYGQENFLRLEEFCRKNYFTPYQSDHIWLTNLGKIRIQQVLHAAEQIGEFKIEEQATSLQIPSSILFKIARESFEQKNGFWNKTQACFYFSKSIKKRIGEIQKETNKELREKYIEEFAKELQIDKAEISRKVDEKLHKLAEILRDKEEFEIKPVIRDLQMEYQEFINFINSFEKPYLILNNKIIFSKKRIQEEEEQLRQNILKEAETATNLTIEKLTPKLKCADRIILRLLTEAVEAKKIKGFWIKENEQFLTEQGIKNRMLESKTFMDLRSVIEEITPTEDDLFYLESILHSLIENKQIQGIYDPETQIFQSNDIAGETNLINERERFETEIRPHLDDLDKTYQMLKVILNAPDLKPQDIDEYEKILESSIRKILNSQTYIKRLINNANHRLNSHVQNKVKKSGKRMGKDRKIEETESLRQNFESDEYIAGLLNDFENWKSLIFAIEQKAGQIVFLKKKLKNNSDDAESAKKLEALLEYLGFSE